MRNRLNVLVLVGVALLSAYFMASAYWRARDDAIAQLAVQEQILASQAVKGITEYFSHYRQMLEFLAKSPEVVQSNDRGERLLRDLFLSQGGDLLSVTRVGTDGRILYTYPAERTAGQNILEQAHVRLAFETRRPVVSQVFRSVQGFECVALHVPVFDAGRFAGTLAVLVPFETISRLHVEGIRIGRSGHAILISGEGIELYCPVPGHIRRAIQDTSKGFPAMLEIAGRMVRGESGRAAYEFDWVEQSGPRLVRKHVYFTPVHLENTFWSIAVTAPEEEALMFIRGFRNRWILGMAILMMAFGVWGFFLARTMLQLHREETRRVAQEVVLRAEREREKALRDSDEEKARLGEQLRQAQKLEAIGQLAGGVAHDYNNLLTVQLGHLSLLREGPPLPPEVDESLREIERSARMAAQLTRQLLAFSRRQVLQKQRLDLNDVLENLLRMLRRILPEDIVLELNPAPESLWLDADAGMMEQVVMNLVVNARDAMPGGGRLTLATQAVSFSAESLPPAPDARPGHYACLVVTDTGEGMDAVTRARIFEPFFTTKDPSKGTGLGLATVYGIVKQHSGWIEVESAEQRGTVIRVYYPAATADAESGADQLHELASPLRGDGQTILVAEDNPAVRQTLTTSLQRLNYAVLAAAGTAEALGLWQAHHRTITLLLTDMVMRDGDNGLELARALRVDRPELPVLIMSGYSQDLVSGGLDADMEFLPKPWTTEVLALTLRRCLSARSAGP